MEVKIYKDLDLLLKWEFSKKDFSFTWKNKSFFVNINKNKNNYFYNIIDNNLKKIQKVQNKKPISNKNELKNELKMKMFELDFKEKNKLNIALENMEKWFLQSNSNLKIEKDLNLIEFSNNKIKESISFLVSNYENLNSNLFKTWSKSWIIWEDWVKKIKKYFSNLLKWEKFSNEYDFIYSKEFKFSKNFVLFLDLVKKEEKKVIYNFNAYIITEEQKILFWNIKFSFNHNSEKKDEIFYSEQEQLINHSKILDMKIYKTVISSSKSTKLEKKDEIFMTTTTLDKNLILNKLKEEKLYGSQSIYEIKYLEKKKNQKITFYKIKIIKITPPND